MVISGRAGPSLLESYVLEVICKSSKNNDLLSEVLLSSL